MKLPKQIGNYGRIAFCIDFRSRLVELISVLHVKNGCTKLVRLLALSLNIVYILKVRPRPYY